MAQIRGRNRRQTPNVVGTGGGGYKVQGEKYVMPELPKLLCLGCRNPIKWNKSTGLFNCYTCGCQFTSVEIQQAIREYHRADRAEYRDNIRAMVKADADEKRVARIIKESGRTSVVYYIRFRDTVKIGTSIDVASRLAMHPWEELLGLEPGGVQVERRRHKDLRAARLDGEWFELTDDVRDYIAKVNEANAAWFGRVFGTMGELPVAKQHARFPALRDYPAVV